MSLEKGFLDANLREPAEMTHRLVYADWLEEQGDVRRAEFLRLEVRRLQNDPQTEQILLRQRELLPEIGADWLALLDVVAILGCRRGGTCPGNWNQLSLTLQARVRECRVCGRFVEHTRSLERFREQLDAGAPVALDSRIERTLVPEDLDPLSPPGEDSIHDLREQIRRLGGSGRPGRRRRPPS